jgi:ABC-type transport system involved in multi-copper enzyme maturation permease subunit
MVWIALGLLGFTVTIVLLNTAGGRWGMGHRRWVWRNPTQMSQALADFQKRYGPYGPNTGRSADPARPIQPSSEIVLTYERTVTDLETISTALPWSPPAAGLQQGVVAGFRGALAQSGFYVFTWYVVFAVFLSFLLPIWNLSFAAEALAGEREDRSLIWLLTRPLPRPSIYLAKFVALLPWTVSFNLGGFALMCLAAGSPGRMALSLYWPAVLGATLAFSALFHLMGACFRRAAVVAIVYTFFLETILGNLPGYMKRISIGFYTRCVMFDAAEDYGIHPANPGIYLPVSGATAWCVLLGVTVVLLVVGMMIFARAEYREES